MNLSIASRTLVLIVASFLLALPAASQIVTSSANGVEDIHVVDLDGDGLSDVISASKFDDSIRWFKNDGTSPMTFTEVVVYSEADGATAVDYADLDGDGVLDIVSASTKDNTIAWYQNNDDATFTAIDISTTALDARDVATGDVNGDGFADVVSASSGDDTVGLYRNDGTGQFTFQAVSDSSTGTRSVALGDVNGDGALDIVSAASGRDVIELYVNDGALVPSFTRVVVATSTDVRDLFMIDVNGDTVPDIVAADQFNNTVTWYESDGAASPTFTTHPVDAQATGVNAVYAQDIDADGDVDLFAAAKGSDTVFAYENTGGAAFTRYVVTDIAPEATAVFVSDITGDAISDVVIATEGDGTIQIIDPTESTVLPVELSSLTASLRGSAVEIAWQTATETNNAGFYVERSVDDGGFTSLGFVDGAGTTTTPQRYRFTDAAIPAGASTLTFRLRQVDLDGTEDLSSSVTVELAGPSATVLHAAYPNPARGSALLAYETPEAGPVRIALYNLLGQQVATVVRGTQPAGRHEVTLDLSRLQSGVYFVRLQSPDGVQTQRLTVVR